MTRPLRVAAVVAVLSAGCSGTAGPATTSDVPLTTLAPVATTTTVAAPITTTSTTTSTAPPVPIGVPEMPQPDPAPPDPGLAAGFTGAGVVTLARGGAELYAEPGGEPFEVGRAGLVFAALSMEDDWIEVFTSCDTTAWVRAAQVRAEPAAASAAIGAGFDFGDAVIVVDPGHGGPWNTGATSPSGLVEKAINLDIGRRVRDLLNEPHTVDWATGTIYTGSDIPAAAEVILTRTGDGDRADYEAGLTFRSTLANSANATAMVSIHNNAGWEIELDHPGVDVYYQSQLAASRRFAKIMVEELLRSFGPFEADWVGAIETGAKSRLSPREGHEQYYGVLRRTLVPTVITEGAYIANQSEADLLATPAFRQAYAEGVYRALIRFLTTNDVGGGHSSDPVIWEGNAGSGDARPECVIPAQS
jgi:N-acetylmuramoyl-L-alanine amidase